MNVETHTSLSLKVGHFATDCTAYANVPAASPADPHSYKLPRLDHEEKLDEGGNKSIYTPRLRKLYQKYVSLSLSLSLSLSN